MKTKNVPKVLLALGGMPFICSLFRVIASEGHICRQVLKCKITMILFHKHGVPKLEGVISLCLLGISPSDFASFAHHFASFPHEICFISPTNCFISPTNCFISPTSCFISPTKFSLPHHYFASLCQKLEHIFLIFFPFFQLWSLILNNLFSGNC